MPKIQSIRNRRARGETVSEIARNEGVSAPTVRKYLKMDDFSPKPPVTRSRPSVLDPYKDVIESWLDEDERNWRKQRHTAKRIYDRLVDEYGADIGYTTVQQYVKRRRSERRSDRDSFLKLVWTPGEAQVDFGDVDVCVYGKKTRMHFLVVDFPFSNVGLAQIFPGENAECVCLGLADIFNYIGGVPLRLVFDNATGVGRRIGDVIRTSELFSRMSCHYGFEFSFCNPASGHEKGAVENKVCATRRNLFVPAPNIYDPKSYNRRLLDECMARSDKPHYAKGTTERELFVEDCFSLSDLPESAFNAVSYERMKCDKYGYVVLDGRHRYAVDPAFSKSYVIVGKSAFDVEIFDADGNLLCTHKREYRDAPTSSDDPASQLRILCNKPRAWQNSQVRFSLPDDLREAIDSMEKAERNGALRTLRDAADQGGWDAAISAAESCLSITGTIERSSIEIMVAAAIDGREAIIYDDPVDLGVYDVVYSRGEK